MAREIERESIQQRRNQCDVYKFYEPPNNKMNNKSKNYRPHQIRSEIRDEFLKAPLVASISHEMRKNKTTAKTEKRHSVRRDTIFIVFNLLFI